MLLHRNTFYPFESEGPKWKSHKYEQILFEKGDYIIELVGSDSPIHILRRTHTFARFCDLNYRIDMPLFFQLKYNHIALIGRYGPYAKSILVLKPMESVWYGSWKNKGKNQFDMRRIRKIEPILGCIFFWNNEDCEQIKKYMLDTAIEFTELKKDQFPLPVKFFSDKERFYKKYFKNNFSIGLDPYSFNLS